MFNVISWQSYWTMLAICLAVYYLVIFVLFYRSGLKMSFLDKISKPNHSLDVPEFQSPSPDSDEAVVYACMDELNAFFEEAKKRRWNKNELVCQLGKILKKYRAVNSSGYQQSISNVLLNQCEHICSVHLSREELSSMWLGE